MLVIAHRGASADHAENTMAAFEAAARQHADGIELDLRRTADGELAVRHDPTLPDGRLVVDLTRRQLPSWVPVLGDVLSASAGFQMVNLEIKNWPGDPDFDPSEAVASRVVAELQRHPALRERVLVSSFHLPTIDRVKQLDPELPTGWLTIGLPDPEPMLEALLDRGHRAVHPHAAFVDEALVAAARGRGVQVNVWTVDDPARMLALEAMGVDAVITNVPAAAVAALSASSR